MRKAYTITKTSTYSDENTIAAAVAMNAALADLTEYLRFNFKNNEAIQLKLREKVITIGDARGVTCTISVYMVGELRAMAQEKA